MRKLTALIFAAAIVPAMALSTAAFAEESEDMRAGEQAEGEQRTGEQAAGEQRSGEPGTGEQAAGKQQLSSRPAGALHADDVIGETLKHRGSGEDVGEIQDLVIGKDGRVVGVVVKTGGFLGLGGQNIGLGWDDIEQATEENESTFYTDMNAETLRNAPDYERE